MNNFIQVVWETIYGGGLFSVAFIVFAGAQWIWIIRFLLGNKKSHLFIPLIGGISGCLAIVGSGVPEAQKFWWIPFVMNPGSLWMIGGGIYYEIIFRVRKISKSGKQPT